MKIQQVKSLLTGPVLRELCLKVGYSALKSFNVFLCS